MTTSVVRTMETIAGMLSRAGEGGSVLSLDVYARCLEFTTRATISSALQRLRQAGQIRVYRERTSWRIRAAQWPVVVPMPKPGPPRNKPLKGRKLAYRERGTQGMYEARKVELQEAGFGPPDPAAPIRRYHDGRLVGAKHA